LKYVEMDFEEALSYDEPVEKLNSHV